MGSVPIKPRCQHPDGGPSCLDLFKDPERILADRELWPAHICDEVARASTMAWAERHAWTRFRTPFPPYVKGWIRSQPLLVGSLVFPGRFGTWPEQDEMTLRLSLPLVLTVKAALILELTILFVDVTAFAIVSDHPLDSLETDGKEPGWLPGTMQFTTAGWQCERVQAFCANADRWWRWFAGKQTHGRPEKSEDTRSKERAMIVAACREHYQHQRNGEMPRQWEIADAMAMSPKRVHRIIGQHWDAFLREMRPYIENGRD